MSSTNLPDGVERGDIAGEENRSRRGRGRTKKSRWKRSAAQWRTSRAMTLAVAAKEYIWLWDKRHGISANEIATRAGLSIRRVREGIKNAEEQEKRHGLSTTWGSPSDAGGRSPQLIPIFPLGSYTPQSPCAHYRPIRAGSLCCCMVCHLSGIDGHPALRRDPRTDPSPEPKPAPPPPKKNGVETRKQRRGRQFAGQGLSSS
jgi:hypothetical protein